MCRAQRLLCSLLAAMFTVAMVHAQAPVPAQGQAQPQGQGRGNQPPAAPRKLMLVDRTGAQTMLAEVPGNTNGPRVSPDGTRIAYGSGGLWVGSVMNVAAAKRIGDGQFPYWSADGTRLFFSPAAEVLSWRRVDAEDAGEQLWTPVRAPESRSPDGKVLSYVVSVDNKFSAWTMNLETRQRTEIPDSGPEALGTNISPDGRWIAYQSTATGMYEVYVQPLGRPGAAVKVTTLGGAFRPLWSKDMRELSFDSVDEGVRQLWVVAIRTEPTFALVGEPQRLPIKGFVQAGVGRRMYDRLPDGRFVMMFP
jgi:Tol biopolymer transport system component